MYNYKMHQYVLISYLSCISCIWVAFLFGGGGYQFVCFKFRKITSKRGRKIISHEFDKFGICRYNNEIPCKNLFVFYLQN